MVSTVDVALLTSSSYSLIHLAGLTESCGNFSHTLPQDVFMGSSGSLLPACEAKLVSPSGEEITTLDRVGELLIKSPSVCLGYYKSEAASSELFRDGWMRTGDQALVRSSPKGHEHLFIVERMKELIKVKVSDNHSKRQRETI